MLLDFGGTLVQSFAGESPFDVFGPVLRSFGWPVSGDRWAEADRRVWPRLEPTRYENDGRGFWDRVHAEVLHELGVPDPDSTLVAALRNAATDPANHPPFPETEEVLGTLRRRGYPVHVVSNNTDYLIESIARLGWSDRFAGLTYSAEAGAEKPDRRVFEFAIARAAAPADEVVHVGDSWEADYLGASRAGLRAIWVNRTGALPPDPAATVVPDLRGVLPWLERHGSGG